jgi:3-oxoacyl-(acyl-carrier-protein) synthase
MPVCFVSIFENLRGPNAVYTPWEGQGAQAIAAGVRAVADGEARCAVVGGCDVKTHALAFLSLQQLGVLDSWQHCGTGTVPGEGAAFLVLEERKAAAGRGARVYAAVRRQAAGSIVSSPAGPVECGDSSPLSVPDDAALDVRSSSRKAAMNRRTPNGTDTLPEVLSKILRRLDVPSTAQAVLAGDGDPMYANAEREAMDAAGIRGEGKALRPKMHLGNLFAASAAVQVGLAALLASRHKRSAVLANCFGHGTEQAAFLLEAL